MSFFYRTGNIHGGKKEKYQGLNQGNKGPKGHYRQRSQEHAAQSQQNNRNQFMPGHVSEKTEGQG